MPIIIVWDTEYTTWDGAMDRGWSGEDEYRELVQLAAQKIDLASGEVLDEMDVFVRPVRNPALSDCFMNLTAITQQEVDEQGLSFAAAYQQFKTFAGDTPCFSYGMDCVILQEGCVLNEIAYDLRCPFLDARVFIKNAGIDVRKYSSGTVSKAFGIDLSGHVHNAMHDVHSLTQALRALHQTLPVKVA